MSEVTTISTSAQKSDLEKIFSPPLSVKVYSPEEALRVFHNRFTPYEQTEIRNYSKVYFVGSRARKRIGSSSDASSSSIYDDKCGSYVLVPHDHIAYRYEVLKVIGKGSFGQVSVFLFFGVLITLFA